jgi:hypothetical protein
MSLLPTRVRFAAIIGLITTSNAAVGDVVCRYTTISASSVNYYTCTELSDYYGITLDIFLLLNPSLDRACERIKPNTEYWVAGCTLSWTACFHSPNSLQTLQSQSAVTDFAAHNMEMLHA